MHIPTLFRLLLLCVLISACGDDNPLLKPAFINPLSPTNVNLYLNDGPSLVSVRVTNENKDPLPNIQVTFTVTQGDAKLSAANTLTDANGVVFTYISGEPNSGPIVLEAAASGLSAKAVFHYGVSASHTSKMIIIAGNNQDVGAGIPATNLLKVKVTDDLGNIAENAAVKFVVLKGNGQVAPEIALTDQNGEASTGFVGSTNTVVNKIAAVVGSDSVFFTLESLYAGSMSIINVNGGIEVKWSESTATRFQTYSLHRAGPDGIYKQIAEFTSVSDTGYTDTDPDLVINSSYLYKLVVHTVSSSVENAVGILFGQFIYLQSVAIDFEVDESRNQLYVSLPELNQIHVFDLTTRELKEKITVGSKPYGISLSHDKSTLYIALYGSGTVAFLDLDTKKVTPVDVSDELGDLKAFDVLEGAPGRVFVSGSPESYGIAYIVVIKTDENNAVERFMKQVVRDKPVLVTDYGKYLYIVSASELYKLDPHGTYTDPAQGSDYHFSSSREFMVVNKAGTKLYLDFEALNTNPVSLDGVISARVPAISPDGSVVHYYSNYSIRSYNTSTFEQLKETGFKVDYLRKLELTSDNTTFIALGLDYGLDADVVYFIHNR